MTNSKEVIDVEEFHNDLQRKSESSLKKKYHKLDADHKALATKLSKTSHANDALHRQVFDMKQRQCRIARLLGFDDFQSVERKVTAEDPWVSGGHSRIRKLEEECARYAMESTKAIQAVRAEFEERLTDAENEAERLRRGRDFAREEAERQAADGHMWCDELRECREELQRCRDEVQMWRNEVNTRLPEMQALIREQQIKLTSLPSPPDHSNVTGEQKFGPSPFHDIANKPAGSNDHSNSLDIDAQHYKRKYESLEAEYKNLLASKKKISQRYFEDLKKWKNFKEWIVREEPHNGNTKRRALRRRKAIEEIGPRDSALVSHVNGVSALVPSEISGSVEGSDADPLKSASTAQRTINRQTLPPFHASHSHPSSPLTCNVSPPSPVPLGESLTQVSTAGSQSQPQSALIPKPSFITGLSEQLPFSQESVTQPSSTPPSHVHGSIATHSNSCTKDQTSHINSSPTALSQVPTCEPKEQLLVDESEHSLETKDLRTATLKSQRNDDHGIHETPTTRTNVPYDYECHHASLPASKPPSTFKSGNADHPPWSSEVRRRTVLVTDTPPRASISVCHQSSPPDSPPVPTKSSSPTATCRRKRKAVDTEDMNKDPDHGNESDPFVASGSRIKPAKAKTKAKAQEWKVPQSKARGKQSHDENLVEYMRYKGRGRYSGSIATSSKTINAKFEIDPTRNGGVNYQFDAVVRDKAKRKTLMAGDCEYCCDYYEAVGPLPPRLQPPMWRSPSRSQDEISSRSCKHQSSENRTVVTPVPSIDTRAKAIESHKHEVSRHRYNWVPTTTPPRYWHIGFPDTQEVEEINRQASDMHARKLQRVEAEANSKDGRYRNRE